MLCLHMINPLREGKRFCFQPCQVIFRALCFPAASARGLLAQPSPAKQGCAEQRWDVAGEVLGQGWRQQQWWVTQEKLEVWGHGYKHVYPCHAPPTSLGKAVLSPPDPARWNSCLSHLKISGPASPEPCPAASCSLWAHNMDFPPQWKTQSWWGGEQPSGWVG